MSNGFEGNSHMAIRLHPCDTSEISSMRKKISSNPINVNPEQELIHLENVNVGMIKLNKNNERAKFYKNNKFKSTEICDSEDSMNISSRKRILTVESENPGQVLPKLQKGKKQRKENSISDQEFNSFFTAFEQHSKCNLGQTFRTTSGASMCSSTKVSPQLKSRKNSPISSERLIANMTTSESSNLNVQKKKKRIRTKNSFGKMQNSDKDSQTSTSQNMSSMLVILDSLKQL
uniref:Uncharacterized protein n=1 Tax=Euplotes harpa TaxID=151035 RepID=A0A7S3NAM9_9SPIT|mmetsp:Transcript_40870/g.46908  ORF Transcript_40870/g.46908 Transcript_40870/m.46908 type:complete len:232 (+) Transcript_40870:1058-1753(+)